MPETSPEKHFVCQSQSCSNRCDSNHTIHCGQVSFRHHFGYGHSYKCEKCGAVRRRRNGHRVYDCKKCNHLYCYNCCFK